MTDALGFVLTIVAAAIASFQFGLWWRDAHPRPPRIRDTGDPTDCNEHECADGLPGAWDDIGDHLTPDGSIPQRRPAFDERGVGRYHDVDLMARTAIAAYRRGDYDAARMAIVLPGVAERVAQLEPELRTSSMVIEQNEWHFNPHGM